MLGMSTITYKCPNCSGRLEFDSTAQTMKCPFCDSAIDVASLAYLDEALGADSSQTAAGFQPPAGYPVDYPPPQPGEAEWLLPNQTWTDEEQEGMIVYTCSTCAGAIVSDLTLSSTSCPYCGNPIVITDRFSGYLKPDMVIPFQLTKSDAKAALLKHYQDKPLLPKFFKDDNRIDEIKGVYVPYWLFSSTLDAEALYNCTTVRNYSDNKYNYTETRYYSVNRSGTVEFMHVPVDGSIRLADDLTESIEPFDYTQLIQFQSAYLAGYSANIYDVTAETAISRAQERMKTTAEEVVRTSVTGYSTVKAEQMDITYRNPRCLYALLPVWLLSSTFEGKVYTFAMNGQTGRLVGDVPVDKSLRVQSFLKTLGIAFAAILIIAIIFGWTGGYV